MKFQRTFTVGVLTISLRSESDRADRDAHRNRRRPSALPESE